MDLVIKWMRIISERYVRKETEVCYNTRLRFWMEHIELCLSMYYSAIQQYRWSRTHMAPGNKCQRHYFANKGPSSQGYGFSCGHVWMWGLDCEESWALKNWCFWTVMLKKTLESPLDCKEIQPVHSKGNQSWIFIGRTVVEAETQYFGHLMWRADSFEKTLMLGKLEGGRRRGLQDEMVGWHHQHNGHEFE